MKKRLRVLLVAVLLVIALMPMSAKKTYAQNLPTSGNCGTLLDDVYGSNATFTYASDTGVLTISGSGEIGSRAFESYTDKAQVKKIIIGEGITAISANAFAGLTGVTEASLPEGLLTIGEMAFYNCFDLDAIEFPDTLEEIETQAFYNDGISELDFPASLKRLNWDAFGAETGYGSITKVIMRSTEIEFAQPTATSYKIPNSLNTAGPIGGDYDYQFAWTTEIPAQAFAYLGVGENRYLTSIILPDTITEIGASAFSGQYNLDSITIPNGLKTIEDYAFYRTGLTEVSLPASVEKIGRQSFNACDNLTKVTIWNADCDIYDVYTNEMTIASQATIAGYEDSTAQVYAEKYDYTFDSLGEEPCSAGGEHDWQLVNHKATFTDNGYQECICSKCGKSDGIAIGALAVTITSLEQNSYVYTGKAITPNVTLANADGVLADNNYTLRYENNLNAGTAKVTITLQGDNFTGRKTLTFKITKAVNPFGAKGKTASVKYKKLKKKNQTLSVSKVMTFTKDAKDTKNYTLVSAKKGSKSFKKYFKINKTTGKVTVVKGLKKGTYKVKIKVKALGNKNYKSSTDMGVTFTVKVK
ncbi:leucine-rich repeat domain-containing protein [Eubacterium oxidoreducens]|uniref:Leucine rich repeat-containing protein n=1 Tax=Eubacterium oxidoreducens TaxID=1732 RepID=A0A1G6BLW5_EUBOX|nr:leucine-rich repeat domain-containing protein [Eubacterium oxidoreducens]SDB21603.1 Leucine rich repeat-containing protein [Eubacterium oxidoreducens]